MEVNSYKKLRSTLAISFCIMYLVMFLNVNSISDIHLSLTRLYMALLMVTSMAVLMILMMPKMYPTKAMNRIILIVSVIVFSLSLMFLRSQSFVSDHDYLRAMIPHHSSAIMTSKHAAISDPEIKKLAEEIMVSQQREINLMEEMLRKSN